MPLLSKFFERLIYYQLNEYLKQYLNSLLCGFRKFHSTQHAPFRLLQEWQNEIDTSGFVGTISMDLSKAYDCLLHDLLITKFETYGISKSVLNLLLSYFSNRKQPTKVNSSYSVWYHIIRGVPQGSILDPLLFNLFINDLFLFLERTNIRNFADDNTKLEDLQHDMKILLNWFKINLMKPNPKKFQFMILGKGSRLPVILNINNIKKRESQKVMLLGLTIDFLMHYIVTPVISSCFAKNKKISNP